MIFRTLTNKVSFVLVALCWLVMNAGCDSEQSETFTGLPGGHEGPTLAAGPPMDSESWHKVPGNILEEGMIWGQRVNARTTFKLPGGGMGLLYSSHPGPDRQQDREWRENQISRGLTTGPSGSIAYTRDLFNWHDYPGNPVLNEIQRSWQTHHRVHTRDMLYDPRENRWVAYFGNIDPHNSPGIREVGTAYSKDMVNWDYADGPILTIEDYAAMVPHRIEATEEELFEHGRVYLNWAMFYNGRYYITISGTETVGHVETSEDVGVRSIRTGRIVLAGDSPEGPFEHVAEIEAISIAPGSKPVYWNGKWYSVFAGTWDGQPGFGLAWSDQLFGRYTVNPDNPIITVESTQRSNPILFNYDGTWGVLFSQGANWWEPLPLRMAIAGVHPSLFLTDR